MNDQCFRLRTGDVILLDGKRCPVVRVNDCAAVVAVAQPAREFVTLFGKRVRVQPKAALVRISPNSEAPILYRPAAPKPCLTCSGLGYIVWGPYTDTCQDCHGTGRTAPSHPTNR